MEFINEHLVLIIFLFVINIVAFVAFGIDKSNARKGGRRIPELYLMLLAVFGGSIGAYIGMYFFHHKKAHTKFTAGIPAIIIVQLFIVAILVIIFDQSTETAAM